MKKFTALFLMLFAFAFFTSAWAPGLSSANMVADEDPGFAISTDYQIVLATATIGQPNVVAIADTNIVTARDAGVMRSDTPIMASPARYALGQNHRSENKSLTHYDNHLLTAGANMGDTTAPTSETTFKIRR